MRRGIKIGIIVLGICLAGYFLLWLTGMDRYVGVLFRTTVTPEKAYDEWEEGRYGGWSWTPDGRIMYVKSVWKMSHVKGMGQMGYVHEGYETQICVINPDGTDNKVIKRIGYLPKEKKKQMRIEALKKERGIKEIPFVPTFGMHEIRKQVEEEYSIQKLDREIYPDPALAHIGFIDWNGKNNKLVFVANDGKGKTGIAISDTEFKEVKWIKEVDGMNTHNITFSPDGKKVMYQFIGQIYIINLENMEDKKITKEIRRYGKANWMPNGKEILTDIGILNLDGELIREFKESVGDPSISPDEKWVVYTHGIMNLETGEHRKFTHQLGYPKWSPDGKYIIEGWEGGIHILDFENNLVKNLRSLNPNESGGENVIAAFKEGQ